MGVGAPWGVRTPTVVRDPPGAYNDPGSLALLTPCLEYYDFVKKSTKNTYTQIVPILGHPLVIPRHNLYALLN